MDVGVHILLVLIALPGAGGREGKESQAQAIMATDKFLMEGISF